MKKAVFTIALILGLQLSLTAVAQNNDLIALRVPHFVRPLVEKWVTEYQKSNINVDFQFVSGKSQDNNNTISFTTDDDAVAFARFAVLPITTKASKAQQLIGSHRLNAKKLKSLFFEKEDFDEEEEDDNEQALHIYTGNGQQSVSRFIASYFKQETANYKGKKISGDDSFLNTAISRDPLGITFNPLSNIFDLQSRHLKNDLTLVGLDLKKDVAGSFSDKGSLDEVLQILENEKPAEVAVEKVAISFNGTDEAVNRFLQWVLENGTKYNHQYGLLNLDQKETSAQINKVQNKLTAQQ